MIEMILEKNGGSMGSIRKRFNRLIDLMSEVETTKLTPHKVGDLLKKSKLSQLKDDFNQGVKKNLETVREGYRESVEQFRVSKTTRDSTVKMFSIAGNNLKAGVEKVRRVTLASAITGDVGSLLKNIKREKRYLETNFDLDLASCYRHYNNQLAKDNGVMKFRYGGPRDGITRPFCAKALAMEPRTLEEWNRLDNGAHQPGPVSVTAGGYRCRHYLEPVIEGFDEEEKSTKQEVIQSYPEELDFNGLTGEALIDNDINRNLLIKKMMGGDQGEITIDTKHKNTLIVAIEKGNSIKRMDRILDFGHKSVLHYTLEIEKSKQGQGFTKKLLNGQFDFYRMVGIKEVELVANVDIGSYAWAKYGFLPRRNIEDLIKSNLLETVNQKISGHPKKELIKIIKSRRKDWIWKVADYEHQGIKYGKQVLMNQIWRGYFDLNNLKQLRRFKDYVQGKKL